MINRLQDYVLAFLQKRCSHPGNMVAADILEGDVDRLQIKYCRRCGAVKINWMPGDPGCKFISLESCWRSPDPFLWTD